MHKGALLVISFGTTFPDALEQDLGGIERALQTAYPERIFYRIHTSQLLREHNKAQGLKVWSLPEALTALRQTGVRDVLIQPTHFLAGPAYKETVLTPLQNWQPKFPALKIGRPLLSEPAELPQVAAGKHACKIWAGLVPSLLANSLQPSRLSDQRPSFGTGTQPGHSGLVHSACPPSQGLIAVLLPY